MTAPYAVTVPYYSNPAYLRLALDSVLAQTDADWRCTVVDDSPDDSAREVVEALGDERIRLVRNPTRLGVGGNFNRCLEVAGADGAELAVILHGDDLLEPRYVERIRQVHVAAPDAACVAPKVTVIDTDGTPHVPMPDRVKAWLWPDRLPRLRGERGLQLLLRGQFFYCPAVSYRLSLVPSPAFDPGVQQVMDLLLYGRVLLGGGSIVLEPERLYRYRRHAASDGAAAERDAGDDRRGRSPVVARPAGVRPGGPRLSTSVHSPGCPPFPPAASAWWCRASTRRPRSPR